MRIVRAERSEEEFQAGASLVITDVLELVRYNESTSVKAHSCVDQRLEFLGDEDGHFKLALTNALVILGVVPRTR
jgi:hypothetical protein